ncbi:MAG: tetratricopeptide repeat protein [Dictyoglomus sp.]
MTLRRSSIFTLLILLFASFLCFAEDLNSLKQEYEIRYYKNPNDPEILFNLMVLYGALGDLENLYKCYKALERVNPNYLKDKAKENIQERDSTLLSLYKTAFSYYFLGEIDKAILYFEKIYSLKPRDDWVIAYLAYLYYLKDELEKTENLINIGLKVNKDNEAFHALLCALYLRKGRYFSALKEYFITMDIVQRKGYKNIWEILKGLR